ncbi:MAG: sensor histidine kinase [Sphingobacteriales bacterium]|nr:MAG: sensor histidine kinase [Sphingobacteriales bacterium]
MKRRLLVSILLPLAIVSAHAQPPDPHSLLNELKTKPDDTAKTTLYGKLADAYDMVNPDSSVYYANKGIALAKNLKYDLGEGKLLQQLGIIYFRHKELDTAAMYFNQAMPIFKKINYRKGIAMTYNSIGITEGQKGSYNVAIKNFLLALDIYKADKDEKGIRDTYMKLGLANELSKHEEEALRYYGMAKAMYDQHPPSNMSIALLNNIGILYAKKAEYKKSLEYFEKGIEESKNLEFNPTHIALITDAANAYSRLGNKKRALTSYKEAYAKAVKYQLPEEKMHALVNMASNLDSNEWAEGIVYLKEAMESAQSTQNTGMLVDIYHAISEVYAVGGQYRDAYLNAFKYHMLSDSLLSKERSSQVAEMQAKYEADESKATIQQLELANQKTTLQRNLVVVAVLAVCLIIGILWSYYRKVSKLNRELHESNLVKDKLFSVIGHDLRSPLGGLVQTLELLESDMLTAEETREVVTELKSRGEGAYEILNSMLLWGKSQLQGTQLNMMYFDPIPHIEKITHSLNKQAQDKQIIIKNNINAEIKLNSDIDHFDFIIRNLLSNAIKFSHEASSIEVNAMMKNDKVLFSVADHGVGISAAAQQDFLHSNLKVNYGTKGEKGTGIGLLLIKEYVNANKGKLWFESIEGQGTTFYFSLMGNLAPITSQVLSEEAFG